MLEVVFLLVALGVSALTLAIIVGRWTGGTTPLPIDPRPPIAWGLFDLCAAIAIYFLAQLLLVAVMAASTEIDLSAEMATWTAWQSGVFFAADGIAKLLVVVFVATQIAVKGGQAFRRLGLTPSTMAGDVRLALTTFALLAGPIYAIQAALTHFFPSEHPLLEQFEREPSLGMFAVLSFAAVIAAPIGEEIVFRLLLQGGLEYLPTAARHGAEIIFGRMTSPPAAAVETCGADGAEPAEAEHDSAPPRREEPVDAEIEAAEIIDAKKDELEPTLDSRPRIPLWPTFASSALFAVVHSSHGPDPIPLFFFAFALGMIYRATHRLLPCILVHMLLNGCSMLMLLVGTMLEKTAG